MTAPRILICAGDPSGDLYASLLIAALKRLSPEIGIDAVGGKLCSQALSAKNGDRFIFDLASLGVTGFVEPVRRIPTLYGLLRRLRTLLGEGRTQLVVPIDFYGFNRRLLEEARRAGVPSAYFISPQVWASRPGRIKTLKRLVSRMLVIFPFEEKLYKDNGVPALWVGHPLLDILPEPLPARHGRELRLGILPGSRGSELARHLPLLTEAASRIAKDFPKLELSIFAAPQQPDSAYAPWLKRWRSPQGRRAVLVRETDYALRRDQDLVLCSSGTATLENALLGLPMVVVYKLSWPTYLLARALIKVEHIAMANILAGTRLVPELVQHQATSKSVAEEALALLSRPKRLESMRAELAALRTQLGGPGAMERTAQAVLREIPAPGRRQEALS